MSGVLGALGLAAMYIGLQVQPAADVSSVADAIALARQQRVRLLLSFFSRLCCRCTISIIMAGLNAMMLRDPEMWYALL